jgi:hypothetical protein
MKSIRGSIQYQQTKMTHTKRVIFMVLPLLFVPLVYGLSSTPDACAVRVGMKHCDKVEGKPETEICCWLESTKEGTKTLCQTCTGKGTDVVICEDPEPITIQQPPASTPAPGPFVLPEDGVLQQPTSPPTSPFAPPRGGGILQQPETSPTTPSEDDQNEDEGSRPLTGQNAPLGGGVLEQPEEQGQETAGPLN